MTNAPSEKPAMPKNLFSALAIAQSKMNNAMKDSENPHYKSKYADLAAVREACLPHLNAVGIAVIQPPYDDETGRYVKTIFIFGETGETTECRIPLILIKNDMQGYMSAVTYGRRCGLMAMSGIAPDDDDGNAAAAAAPKFATAAHMKRELEQLEKDLLDAHSVGALNDKLWVSWKKKMHEENWPYPDDNGDETAYRTVVTNMFAKRKAVILNQPETEQESDTA